LRYLSVCSGIEAATVAWHPLGWTAAAYSEIEKFPSQVLAHHYPDVPNVGDMTKFKEWNIGSIDLLVGGTPCQSFSVAGLRKGLDDPRGNLMLTYLAIADQYRPRWLVWENVPGVLSSNGGKDFGVFLGALGELGYGFAYRILDAQYFGVAQRRRRVFVVGYLGDWRAAAAVLFERHSLSGDSAPSREKRKEAASGSGDGVAISSHWDGDYPHPTLNQSAKSSGGVGFSNQEIFSQRGAYLAAQSITTHGLGDGGELARCLNACNTASGRMDVSVETFVSQPIPFDTTQITSKANYSKPESGDPCHPLAAGAHPPAIAQPICPAVHVGMAVRRLTPVECERLQGFPDSYTDIQPKGKATPDGPRYKALGNSMAVPVMAWIGKRIQEVENLQCKPNK
jgi:DNA (cytosine-5)-methyltransferase 1